MILPKGSQEYGLPIEEKKTSFSKAWAAVFFILLIILSMSVVTQTIAHKLGYPADLGGSNEIYYPWSWLGWEARLSSRYLDTIKTAESYGFLVFAVGFAVMANVILLMQGRPKAYRLIHGSARWANLKEIALSHSRWC